MRGARDLAGVLAWAGAGFSVVSGQEASRVATRGTYLHAKRTSAIRRPLARCPAIARTGQSSGFA